MDKTKELWIDLGKGFIYFNTTATTLKEAKKQFIETLENNNCIMDNFGCEKVELREWYDTENNISDYTVLEEDNKWS